MDTACELDANGSGYALEGRSLMLDCKTLLSFRLKPVPSVADRKTTLGESNSSKGAEEWIVTPPAPR
jgi:hypothetical protein